MLHLGFELRMGAETFYMEQDHAPLPRIIRNGKVIDIIGFMDCLGFMKIEE